MDQTGEKLNELKNLDWPQILEKLRSLATSEIAGQKLRSLAPLSSQEAAELSFLEIQEVEAILLSGQRCFMSSLDLYGLWFQRLSKGAVLKPLELKDLRHFCLEVIALKETLRKFSTPWLKTQFSQLMDASEPLSAIDQIMTPEGDIRTDASEKLYLLFREKTSQAKAVQQILDRLIHQHELEPVLQDRYVTNREGRWVLPVRSGMQHHFEGIIHASSQTKQTVFMEPKEIIPLNNRLRQIEVEIEDEIERLLTELSKYLFGLVQDFVAARDQLIEMDVRFAQAQLTIMIEGRPCRFNRDRIHLISVRHPSLILDGSEVVPNTVQLDAKKRILLLSGPNAGGKTVLLKSVGLAAHMARCGLPICASVDSELPFFRQIHVSVGDSQSVDAHLSTFAAHLKILSEATSASGSDHLLLIDEICGSTDPEEGTALARGFIERYTSRGIFGVITSHLGPLKSGWSETSGVTNGSLEYDSGSGRPTYQFLMGVPGQSLAIQTAKRVGVDESIIKSALSYLSPQSQKYQGELEDLERAKAEVRALKSRLDVELKKSKDEQAHYTELTRKLEVDRDKLLKDYVKEAEKKVEQMIEKSRVDDVFRRHERLEQTKFALPEIVKASAQANAPILKIDTAETFAEHFKPGSKVFAPTLGRDVVIQGKPNGKGEVPILSQSMRLMMHWELLKPPQQPSNPTREVVAKATGFASPMRSQDRTVDVRGLSVDEAITELESQLDTAALHDEDRIKVIHGHGTETLKKSIRQFLSRSVYVKKWKVGTAESGGDGVTWVEIKDD